MRYDPFYDPDVTDIDAIPDKIKRGFGWKSGVGSRHPIFVISSRMC